MGDQRIATQPKLRIRSAVGCQLWPLAVALAAFVTGVWLAPPLAAQSTIWHLDNPAAGSDGSFPASDGFSDTCGSPTPHFKGPLFDIPGGISVEPVYYGEVFSNTRGGLSTNDATHYQGLLDVALAVDLERTRLPVPGKFFLLAQNTHGRGLTEDFLGDAQVLSNIDSFDNIMRVNEYWWEFGLLDDNVTVRLGKQDVNTEFLLLDSATDFVHSSFGLTPAATLPTYPAPSFGAVVLARLNDSWQLKVGVWDALAFGGRWGFSGNDTVFMVGELEYFSYAPRFLGGQVLDETIGNSFVGGLVYQGPLSGRDEDVAGAGVAWAELFQGGTNQETVVELFYKAQLTPRVSVQPDLQYIGSPSGIQRDALAVGVRFQVTL